jgi:hypothetical protein
VQFVEVEVRQAHPGPGVPPHRSDADKHRDANAHAREHAIPWPLLVDRLEGEVHKQYALLPDPTFLIGTDGRIAFIDYWTHGPTLHRAIEHLRHLGGRGIVGESRALRPLATMTDGWPAIRRGLPQSFVELETAFPGGASSVWLGWQLRAILGPLARRGTPLPRNQRLALGAAAIALGLGAVALSMRARRESPALAA